MNEQQLAAATSSAPVTAVFAGAGAGKTATVVHRITWLLAKGVQPERIYVITFTKKAAEELSDRIKQATGQESVVVGTFHSICMDWVNRANPYGDFAVLTDTEIAEAKRLFGRQLDSRMELEMQAISFDSILEMALDMLRESMQQENLGNVIEEGSHLIVDEAQDNSLIQWEIVELLADSKQIESVFVVGDFRQSIYEWRNASPERGIEFCKRAKVMNIQSNYRSGENIIYHANKMIAIGGFEEPMIAAEDAPQGRVAFESRFFPLEAVIEEIENATRELVPYEDIAVLCRYNQEAETIASYLEKSDIPVATSIKPDSEDMETIAVWMNFFGNPMLPLSWSLAIGDTLNYTQKIEVMRLATQTRNTLAVETANYLDRNAIQVSHAMLAAIKQAAVKPPETVGDALDLIVPASQIQLEGAIGDTIAPLRNAPVGEYVKELYIRKAYQPLSRSGVTVTTAHSAKGLEFNTVIVFNASQKNFPGKKKGRKREEERRLLFVCATRAKENLIYFIYDSDEWSEFLVDEHGRFLV